MDGMSQSGAPSMRETAPTEQRIAEIEARMKCLTDRPWRVIPGSDMEPDDVRRRSVMSADKYYVGEIPECIGEDETGEHHAEFIAHAPDDIAWLIAELRAARSSSLSSEPRNG